MSFSRITKVNGEVRVWSLARIVLKLFIFRPLGSEEEGWWCTNQ